MLPRLDIANQLPASGPGRALTVVAIGLGGLIAAGLTALIAVFVWTTIVQG